MTKEGLKKNILKVRKLHFGKIEQMSYLENMMLIKMSSSFLIMKPLSMMKWA